MHVAHTPFFVWIPCYTHPFLCVHSVLHTSVSVLHSVLHTCLSMCGFRVCFLCVHSVLHTSLSVCAFRVAHMPFSVFIPCYTHPFICVHSVLHTSLSVCAFHVTHIPFYVCIPCYTHPFLCVHSVLHTSLSMCAFLAVRSGLSAAGLGLELPNLLQEGGLREEGLR